MTLCDAGPLVAILDRGQPEPHRRCVAALSRVAQPLITTWPCLTEAMYLLGKMVGYPGQEGLWQMHQEGKLLIHPNDAEEAARMRQLMADYRDTPMDLADASLVATAETLKLTRIFTLDSHFHAYRPDNGLAFDLIP